MTSHASIRVAKRGLGRRRPTDRRLLVRSRRRRRSRYCTSLRSARILSQMHYVSPGPPPHPPARDPVAFAAVRTRRSSASTSSQRSLLEAEAALKSDEAPRGATLTDSVATTEVHPPSNVSKHQPIKAARVPPNGSASFKVTTRQSSLFASQQKKREQAEQFEAITALQQNGAALSALNEREKARNAQLAEQVEQLCEELRRARGARSTQSATNS